MRSVLANHDDPNDEIDPLSMSLLGCFTTSIRLIQPVGLNLAILSAYLVVQLAPRAINASAVFAWATVPVKLRHNFEQEDSIHVHKPR